MQEQGVKVIGSVFSGPGQEGDFAWMIEQADYDDALFVFNDNEEQFRAHRENPTSGDGCAAGGGNAVIRPYQCSNQPRAAGIPTGADGRGYAGLSAPVRATLDEALAAIRALLQTGLYARVYYSSDGAGGLGTGIYQVGNDVKAYIVAGLVDVSNPRLEPSISMFRVGRSSLMGI